MCCSGTDNNMFERKTRTTRRGGGAPSPRNHQRTISVAGTLPCAYYNILSTYTNARPVESYKKSAHFGSKNLSVQPTWWWSTAVRQRTWSIRLQSESIPRTWRVSCVSYEFIILVCVCVCVERIKPHGHRMLPRTVSRENYHENMTGHWYCVNSVQKSISDRPTGAFIVVIAVLRRIAYIIFLFSASFRFLFTFPRQPHSASQCV